MYYFNGAKTLTLTLTLHNSQGSFATELLVTYLYLVLSAIVETWISVAKDKRQNVCVYMQPIGVCVCVCDGVCMWVGECVCMCARHRDREWGKESEKKGVKDTEKQ